MESTTVSSQGQVTIPKEIRQRLGIREGSKIEFSVVGSHAEMHLVSQPTTSSAASSKSGFGLLKSARATVPADFDPAVLLQTNE